MGKTSRPLSFLITNPDLLPYFQDLITKGHTVNVIEGAPFDRVLGPNCFKLTPQMLDHLPKNTLEKLITEARQEKYGKQASRPKLPTSSTNPRSTNQPELFPDSSSETSVRTDPSTDTQRSG